MASELDLYSLVNLLAGTQSHPGFSVGNSLPLFGPPFAMTHWTLQTGSGRWFFHPDQRKLEGFRATHQPSPWIGDYGALTLLPVTGEPGTAPHARSSAFRLDRSLLTPHMVAFRLERYGVNVVSVYSARCAAFACRAEAGGLGMILEPGFGPGEVEVDQAGSAVRIIARGSHGGTVEGFGAFYLAKFDRPFAEVRLEEGDSPRVFVRFAPAEKRVIARVASSFIGFDQAEENLRQEFGEGTLPEVAQQTSAAWQEIFGRFEVEFESDADAMTFANCVYRAHCFPRDFHEFTADGAARHYSPYTGKVEPGELVTDNGFWDTYRTTYPWYALTRPSGLSRQLEGWVQAYREGGWFPQWVSPGYRACMVGTHIDAVFADAVAKGIGGFDLETAYEGLRKHAFEVGSPDGAWGRLGIEEYLAQGWVASDVTHESVARSLDYAYNDWCLAQIARHLGKLSDASEFEQRAGTYRNLWDPSVGFMRGRRKDGSWDEFSEWRWGSPYVEGGPWQSSWSVPHDPDGLAELAGGREELRKRLESMLALEPAFEVGVYGSEIHEMSEMAVADFGQYAHSNQPAHHVLYLLKLMGGDSAAIETIHRVLRELYRPDRFPGDEDNGEMSCWYLFSALGFFPFCPGSPDYVLGWPLVKRAKLRLENGQSLVIERGERGGEVTWNGQPIPGPTVSHLQLIEGGTLRFG